MPIPTNQSSAPLVTHSDRFWGSLNASEARSGQIIGNVNSKIYHVPGCSTYNSVSEKNRAYFVSAEEAEKAGYRKSKACH
jgi:methylphosphotriester-DNA--protein-cysteine methyltransferase